MGVSAMSDQDAREREEAEAKAKRIERWRQTGRVFESTPDLRWLFVELALADGGELDWHDKDRLTDLVAEPIWGSLWSDRSYCDDLMKQGAIFVENSRFHCTALRDFFIFRLISCLAKAIHDYEPKRRRFVWHLVALGVAVALFTYSAWLGGVLAVLYLLNEVGKTRAHHKWQKQKATVESAENVIRRGGFDEPEIIRALETLQHGGAPVPSVLYALLRVPRRNVEHQVLKAYNALDEDKKKALWEQWRTFLNLMLENDDGEAERKKFELLEGNRAEIFKPIRGALDQLADDFKNDGNIGFTSRVRKDMFPSTYSIEIKEDGKQQYYIYCRCDKHTLESDHYSIDLRIVRNPSVYSENLFFFRGDEQKIAPTIKGFLLHYREHGELTSSDIKRISEQVRSKEPATL